MKNDKNTSIKKAVEISSAILLTLWLMCLCIWTALQLKSVQTFAAKIATEFLSEELQTEVDIKAIKVRLFKYLEADQIYVEDQRGDTLLYVEKIYVDLLDLSLEKSIVAISAELQKPTFRLVKYEGDTTSNLRFIVDYFKSDEESEESDFVFQSNKLSIIDASFSYHDYNKADTLERVDYSHVELDHINLIAENARVQGPFIDAKIKELGFRTDDEFELSRMSTQLKIEPELMSFQDLKIQTFSTELHADISFTANSFKSYKQFTEEVYISADFKNALVQLSDLAYFVPTMSNEPNQVLLNGKVNGTVDNLSSSDFELHLNKDTYLVGEFDFRGLPKLSETFIFFNAEELRTNAEGLRNLPFNSFSTKLVLQLPEEFDRLGDLTFNGNFTGFIGDFVAYGKFNSDLGDFGSDISLRRENGETFYKGSLSANDFKLGKLIAQNDLGDISFNVELDGKGIGADNVQASVRGDIAEITYKDYKYDHINLNGEVSSKQYRGELHIDDDNLKFDFEGAINADTSVLVSNFKLNLKEAKLAKLNLFNIGDSLSNLSFKADIDMLGSELEELDGSILIDSLSYSDSSITYSSDSITLIAKPLEAGRDLSLHSSFLNARIKGDFRLYQLRQLLDKDLRKQIPGAAQVDKELKDQDFEYDIAIKNLKPLTKVFLPELRVDSGSRFNGTVNTQLEVNTLNFRSPYISYGGWSLIHAIFSAASNQQGIAMSLNSRLFGAAGFTDLSDFHLSSSLEDGDGKLNVSWEGINDNFENGMIQLIADVDSIHVFDMQFKESYFMLNDSLWKFSDNNSIEVNGKDIVIENLSVDNKSQGISIDGAFSRNPQDSLLLSLRNFDLNYISSFVESEDLTLAGRINGTAVLRDPYNNRTLISDLKATDIVANEIEIGQAALETYWLRDSTGIVVNAFIGDPDEPLFSLKGKVNPRSERQPLDLNLNLDEFPIELAEPFINEYLSELDGGLSGSVLIKGRASEPILNGDLHLEQAQMRVNYLNTVYTLDHKIMIRPDYIGFDLMKIVDQNGNYAIATGTIFHQNYEKFNLDVGMEMENFLGLNTGKRDNDLFYGTGIVSGWSNISGYADQLILELNLTAKDGTDFKIPLKDDVSVSNSDFLVFTNSPQFEEDSTIEIDLSGIQLNFDLNIEPEAKTTIIFDESIGDIIKAQGRGNLKLYINTLGNFNMFGQYELTEGEYLFTLQNILNKKFELSPGSKMMWDGDPYQARLDIQAIYNLRASLYNLMPEDSTGRYKRRVPVELILDLGGYLLNPEINFDIKIPSADELVESRLESVLYVNQNNVNEQELNQQVFGLLLLGQFMPPSTGGSGGTASSGAPGMNNGYELLSNQLSNWISSMSNDFDIGVSYRPETEVSEEEVDLSVTTELLDDRLVLDGTFGYTSNNQYADDQRASNFIGEFMIEYKLKRDGKLRIRGFNRSNNYDPLQINSLYTQGVGLFYQEEFDRFSEVWRKYFRKPKEQNTVEEDQGS